MRTYYQPAPILEEVILNPLRGWLSVISPVARVNLVTNPSVETDTTGYTAVGGSIARSTTEQYHGAYSLAVTPGSGTTDGVYYGTISLTSGTTYAVSCKIKGAAGRPYKIAVATTGGSELVSYPFTATGRWQWVWVFWTETSSTTRRVYVAKNAHANTSVFYVDGLQAEACAAGEVYPTTYIDGDRLSLLSNQFPPAYGWNGAPHASTSYRSAQTRDGGRVQNLDAFKFLVTGISGLGMTSHSHVVSTQPLVDGARYQTSVVPPREFQVSGRFNTHSPIDLRQSRQAMATALNLDATDPRQPIALLYQEYDSTDPVGDTGKIIASYLEGMGNGAGPVNEMPTLTFQQWQPFIVGGDGGAALTTAESIAISNATALMYRDETGDWRVAADPAPVNTIAYNPYDGQYYVGGSFTTIGGTAANRIAKWNPSTNTFSALGTGLSGTANVIKIGPNGDVFVGGTFATAGGTTVNNVARWDYAASTWNALGAGATKGVDNTVNDLALDPQRNLYVVGTFLNAGGAGAVRIAKWTSATNAWSALGTGLNNPGESVIVSLSGDLVYVSGTFTTANAVSVNKIAAWNGTTFETLGSGFDLGGEYADVMRIGPDGRLYVGGNFSILGGQSIAGMGIWNGSGWSRPAGNLDEQVLSMVFGRDGLLYIGGNSWIDIGGIVTGDSFAAWNGSAYILPDIDMPGTTSVNAIEGGPRGELLVAFGTAAGTASAAQLNTLTNNGTALTYPIFTITGPSSGTARLYQLRSYTTGRILSFDLLINTGETIEIRMAPDGTSVVSLVRGDISSSLAPGSNTHIPLVKGSNSIAVLVVGTVTMTVRWAKQYQSMDDLTW